MSGILPTASPSFAARMQRTWNAWRHLPAKEKNSQIAIAAVVLAAAYFSLLWPLTHGRIAKLAYELEKQAVRVKSAGKQSAPATALPASLEGKSLQDAGKELDALHRKLEEARVEVARYEGSFVPLDDSLAMNALKAGLTGLAESGDMEVLALEHVFLRPEDKDRPPTPQLIKEAAQASPFKRPLLVMRARASYRGLMQFLAGLASLPYVAAPVSSDISVEANRRTENAAPTSAPIPAPGQRWLEVQIKFAV